MELTGRFETNNFHIGIEWLESVAFEHIDSIGKKVLILGVGNTAMDCCRSSLRIGAENVKVMARKPRGFFKASDWELEDAEEEKVEIIALDILPMDYLPAVEFIQGDFLDDEVFSSIINLLTNRKIDLVMSDMAPNISGIKISDQARSIYLVELALDVAKKILKKRGNFICKLFQGQGSDIFIKDVRQDFVKVKVFKPKSSRPDSREVYLIAKSYLG